MDFLEQAVDFCRRFDAAVEQMAERAAAGFIFIYLLTAPLVFVSLICALAGYAAARVFSLNRKRGVMIGASVGFCLGAVFVWGVLP